ncbi:hypothetical protein [Trujillonella humicola]|uniref:hypothetical protein n=1 Tax=Trujillonella humicola TaxID=3383699 RepID=UPI00390697C1
MSPGNDWLDQARRLAAGLGESLASAAPAARGDDPGGPGAQPGHGTDCRWCPLCQAAAVLRGERPEVTAALADALVAAAAALRALAAEPAGPARDPPGGGPPAGAPPAGEPPAEEPPAGTASARGSSAGGPAAPQRAEGPAAAVVQRIEIA